MTPLAARFKTGLRLGRVSNLPTVWTNALAGMVLAGAFYPTAYIAIAVALTLFYIGGMWLNDAFDAEIDAQQKADRPIPAGEIDRNTVFIGGFLFLSGGLAVSGFFGAGALMVGALLAATILLYDWSHKRTALAPVIMGATRFLCYALAAYAVLGALPEMGAIAAFGLFAYTIGLTYAAKQENFNQIGRIWPLAILAVPVALVMWLGLRTYHFTGDFMVLLFAAAFIAFIAMALRRLFRRAPGDVPNAVMLLIANMAVYDAVWLVMWQEKGWAFVALACFLITRWWQGKISGT